MSPGGMNSRPLNILVICVLLNQYLTVQGFSPDCRYDKERKILDCTKLGLTMIPSNVFQAKYAQIKLAGNPFVCNCSMSWFLDRIKNTEDKEKITDLNSLKCGSPKHLLSKLITGLKRAEICSLLTMNISTIAPPKPELCGEFANTCDPVREMCVKKGNSYECRCKEGFRKKPGEKECEVFNRCHQNNSCSKNAQCINEIGSYKCICKLGYTGNGKHCEDKDECADKNANECHKDAVCVNHVGGYQCHCKSGFKQYKQGRLCVKKFSTPVETYILASIIVGFPLLLCITLMIFICRRVQKRKQRLAADALLADDDNTNDTSVHLDDSENQQLLAMESFLEDGVQNKGLSTNESTWSEWPDYDEAGV